jgi:hypothetical protein
MMAVKKILPMVSAQNIYHEHSYFFVIFKVHIGVVTANYYESA